MQSIVTHYYLLKQRQYLSLFALKTAKKNFFDKNFKLEFPVNKD